MAELAVVTDQTFDPEVLRSGVPMLVEFGAEWCAPCRQLEPILEDIASEWEGRLRLATLDIDVNAATTMRFGVMGVPTLILFQGGEELERWTGYQPKRKIVERLAAHLG
ncbi:MAG TPA: thioredoxin domain-containing protein [Anaerolineales bacterium]|nr:thioredoxin domain-containing protein [Anaerolineales bacterium]